MPNPHTTHLRNHITATVTRLQAGHANQSPQATQQLAELRHSLGRTPTHAGAVFYTFIADIPDELISTHRGQLLTPTEQVILDTLALYATHQQGRPTWDAHTSNYKQNYGSALRQLISAENINEANGLKRLHKLASTPNRGTRLSQLRGLTSMLKTAAIPLDYATAAEDLYYLTTGHTNNVHIRWARAFHQTSTAKKGA